MKPMMKPMMKPIMKPIMKPMMKPIMTTVNIKISDSSSLFNHGCYILGEGSCVLQGR